MGIVGVSSCTAAETRVLVAEALGLQEEDKGWGLGCPSSIPKQSGVEPANAKLVVTLADLCSLTGLWCHAVSIDVVPLGPDGEGILAGM